MSFGAVQRVPKVPTTYWAPGALGDDNEVTYAAPVVIQGRWVEKRTELQTSQGEQLTSQTHVIVDMDVAEGGFLAQGSFTDATPVSSAREIQGFSSMPDLRNMEQLKRAYL